MFHKCLHLDLNETKMVPPYATMLMNSLEGDILSNSFLKPLVWWHYIDDIFIMWECGEEELQMFLEKKLKKKQTLSPLFMDGVQLPQGWSHFEEVVYFLPLSSQKSWYSFYRPRKDERLSRPWSHPLVLNTGPLVWESSALTIRPLLHKSLQETLNCYHPTINLQQNTPGQK